MRCRCRRFSPNSGINSDRSVTCEMRCKNAPTWPCVRSTVDSYQLHELALGALAATDASAQVVNLSGPYRCVENCSGPGPATVTQNGWDRNLVNEVGTPSRAWVDWPGYGSGLERGRHLLARRYDHSIRSRHRLAADRTRTLSSEPLLIGSKPSWFQAYLGNGCAATECSCRPRAAGPFCFADETYWDEAAILSPRRLPWTNRLVFYLQHFQ
jgi:hypothetical protein